MNESRSFAGAAIFRGTTQDVVARERIGAVDFIDVQVRVVAHQSRNAAAGSLRRGSYTRALLLAATELAPPTLHILIQELDRIPLYNGDIEAAGAPESVVQLRDAIRKADGLRIATPEYNYGVPGVLKNAMDWLSRPPATAH